MRTHDLGGKSSSLLNRVDFPLPFLPAMVVKWIQPSYFSKILTKQKNLGSQQVHFVIYHRKTLNQSKMGY